MENHGKARKSKEKLRREWLFASPRGNKVMAYGDEREDDAPNKIYFITRQIRKKMCVHKFTLDDFFKQNTSFIFVVLFVFVVVAFVNILVALALTFGLHFASIICTLNAPFLLTENTLQIPTFYSHTNYKC